MINKTFKIIIIKINKFIIKFIIRCQYENSLHGECINYLLFFYSNTKNDLLDLALHASYYSTTSLSFFLSFVYKLMAHSSALLCLFSYSGGHWKRIAYPFELVKPGGVEGETTLKDINHQMLMSPSKPIPHPVGDSLTHSCISNRAFGISGKAVAALTRIHTQGRGSITIIRTKG